MDKIEKYINSIYKDTDGKSKEIQDLKCEMILHLKQTAQELLDNGVRQEDSIRIAIERFGEVHEIRKELSGVMRFHKLLTRSVLICSLIILTVASALFSASYAIFIKSDKVDNEIFSQTKAIENKVKNDGLTGLDEYVKDIFNSDNNRVSYVNIKKLSQELGIGNYSFGKAKNKDGIVYSYPDDVDRNHTYNSNGIVLTINNNQYYLEIGYKQVDRGSMLYGLALLSIIICWVLWSIASIINAFRLGALNLGWCIVFIVFSILGYFVFLIVRRFPLKKPKNISP